MQTPEIAANTTALQRLSDADQRDAERAIIAARHARWMHRTAETQRDPQECYDARFFALQYETEVVTLADAIIDRAAIGAAL
jgi:hypothetical protein